MKQRCHVRKHARTPSYLFCDTIVYVSDPDLPTMSLRSSRGLHSSPDDELFYRKAVEVGGGEPHEIYDKEQTGPSGRTEI